MKTSLGVYPINDNLSVETLDYLLVACSLITLGQLDNNQLNKQQKAMRDEISDLYINAVGSNRDNVSLDLFNNNFNIYNNKAILDLGYSNEEYFPSVYYDEDIGKMKRIPGEEVAPEIVKIFKRNYYKGIYGESYKEREINILEDNQDGEYSEENKNTVNINTVLKEASDKNDVTLDFSNEIEADGVFEEMRALHDFFLMKERVDFRELLINYFKMDSNPDLVILQSRVLLEELIEKYKDKVAETLSDYLKLRIEERIPLEYRDTLY